MILKMKYESSELKGLISLPRMSFIRLMLSAKGFLEFSATSTNREVLNLKEGNKF